MHVVATAGHVDHGKSTLVRALTGIDPDRWAVEKERGLTIDLGFAWTTLPSGRVLSFVDVPGHIRFVKNMLAGVGGVDACLLVVDATEGWMPQTEEHLRILELVGLSHGLVALTKVGLVDAETRQLAALELADHLAGTFLETAEVAEVDAVAGTGLSELERGLDRMLGATPPARDRDRPRLWVDRAFAARGAGTVVTGTLTGGPIALDDHLELVPARREVRVRALQTHKESVERAVPGSRVAVNLVGVDHGDVGRGDALVRPGQWHLTRRFDASLHVLPSLDHEVSRRGAYHLFVGAAEHRVEVRVLGAAAIGPGGVGLVRLHLPAHLPLLPGDRYVLRESGRDETVGGGEVLDVAPVLPAARARPSGDVDRFVAERGWVEADELERVTGARRAPTAGRWVVAPDAWEATVVEIRRAIDEAGDLGLDLATLDDRHRLVAESLDGVVVDRGRARAAGAADPLAGHPWLAALRASLFAPPPPDGVARAEVRELVRRGAVVERDGVYFAAEAVADAGRRVADLLTRLPDGVTVADVRDALGSSRKHTLPLLAILDAGGVTRRRGDLRVAGPRLPGAAPAEGRPPG